MIGEGQEEDIVLKNPPLKVIMNLKGIAVYSGDILGEVSLLF